MNTNKYRFESDRAGVCCAAEEGGVRACLLLPTAQPELKGRGEGEGEAKLIILGLFHFRVIKKKSLISNRFRFYICSFLNIY